MRIRSEKSGISVHGIAGTYVVCLGMNSTAKARKGLLGFAIERLDHTRNKTKWLQGLRAFQGAAAPGTPRDSSEAPLQAFFWGDYTASPGQAYTYTVYPVYGAPGALERGAGVELKITTERVDDGRHGVFFNRGVAGSQAYSRRFGDHRRFYKVERYGRERWVPYIKPDDVPKREAWEWLSRGLEEAVLAFIGQAKGKKYSLRAALYEFEYEPVAQALADALETGADVKIVYDAKQSGKDKTGPWRATERTIGRIGLREWGSVKAFERMMIKRTITTISHNKFIVLLENGTPVQVWTGSTNMTQGGIFGQSNVGHVIRDSEIATKYHEYWKELSADPQTKAIRAWNVEQQPDLAGPPPADAITTIFSPRPSLGMLEWYADRLAAAEHSVHFTAAFGVSQQLASKLLDDRRLGADNPFLRYIMMESRPSPKASESRKEKARQAGRPVPIDYYDIVEKPANRVAVGEVLRKRKNNASGAIVQEENLTGLDTHVEFLHTKFMLVDPLTEDPVVITGSANFSDASTRSNDENMLVIRGDTRVADIFFGEFMRMFNHFRERNEVNALTDDQAAASIFLAQDDSWTDSYYEEGTQDQAERLLFA